MERIKNALKNDNLILLLDILAVNLAYFMALSIRVSISDIGGVIQTPAGVPAYFTAFYRFAPIYTVLCVGVFLLFHLYGGVWRYAGANDMMRILAASAVTCILHVVGTILITRRMPLTYYILGAVLQFVFITGIRFARKIVAMELKKRSKKNGMALIVGAGELGQQTALLIQSGEEFRVDGFIDTENEQVGKMLNGVPVYSLDQMQYTLEHHQISCVFLAEPHLNDADRRAIAKICVKQGTELRAPLINSGRGMPDRKKSASCMEYVTIAYSGEDSLSQEDAWLQSILSGAKDHQVD